MKFSPKLLSGIITISLMISSYGISVADCINNEKKFLEHSVTCQSGHRYACEDGTWIDLTEECTDGQIVQSYDNAACNCTNDEEHECNLSGQYCRSTKDSGRCISKCGE